mgnify:FL=1
MFYRTLILGSIYIWCFFLRINTRSHRPMIYFLIKIRSTIFKAWILQLILFRFKLKYVAKAIFDIFAFALTSVLLLVTAIDLLAYCCVFHNFPIFFWNIIIFIFHTLVICILFFEGFIHMLALIWVLIVTIFYDWIKHVLNIFIFIFLFCRSLRNFCNVLLYIHLLSLLILFKSMRKILFGILLLYNLFILWFVCLVFLFAFILFSKLAHH